MNDVEPTSSSITLPYERLVVLSKGRWTNIEPTVGNYNYVGPMSELTLIGSISRFNVEPSILPT